METPLNVATPLTAFWVSVPNRVPPAGLAPMAAVTAPVKPVAMLPPRSRAVTAKPKAVCSTALAGGWVVKVSVAAGPTETPKVALAALVSPAVVAVSEYALPALSTLMAAKVATPETAPTVVVPRNAAPALPVPLVIPTVTLPVNAVAVLPRLSFAATATDGANAAPPDTAEG